MPAGGNAAALALLLPSYGALCHKPDLQQCLNLQHQRIEELTELISKPHMAEVRSGKLYGCRPTML